MRNTGQTLSEYVLAGGLIALVAIGVLGFMGSTVSSLLPGLLDRIFGDGAFSSTVASAPPAEETAPGETALPEGEVAPESGVFSEGTLSITLGNGQTLTLENYPANVARSVETAGANGTTGALLASMESLIQQLEEAGEIDASQANRLQALANQGHRVAEVERILEETAAQYGSDTQGYLNATVYFDGKAYKPEKLVDTIGWSIWMSQVGDDILHADGAGVEMAKFQDLFRDVESDGSLSHPAVREVVTHLSSEIVRIGEAMEDSGARINQEGASPGTLNQMMASTMTDNNSADICDAGGGSDSGIHCP